MSTHRSILEPYKGVSTRHTCPNCHCKRCFSKYIDTEKRIQFPDYVGRCDHEQKCGYHFTPRDYFERNPSEKEKLSEDNFRNYDTVLKKCVSSKVLIFVVNKKIKEKTMKPTHFFRTVSLVASVDRIKIFSRRLKSVAKREVIHGSPLS